MPVTINQSIQNNNNANIGQTTLFSSWYQLYYPFVYRCCRMIIQDDIMAEDVTQEVFIKAFQTRSQFNGQAKFKTWIYRIAHNCCIDFLRKHQKMAMTGLEEWNTGGTPPPSLAESDPFEQLRKQTDRILELLPTPDRDILVMKYRQGLSVAEIGALLQKSESAIKMKLKRARDRAQALIPATTLAD